MATCWDSGETLDRVGGVNAHGQWSVCALSFVYITLRAARRAIATAPPYGQRLVVCVRVISYIVQLYATRMGHDSC